MASREPETADPAADLMSIPRLQQGYTLILPGIEGYSWLNRRIRRGLVEAGVPYAIQIHDWTLGLHRAIYNLRSEKLHRYQTLVIRNKILSYQRNYPHRPVFLIGHSGGGAMSLRTLECLPDRTTISGAILLGAAISPAYDLCPALKHVDRKIWNMTSLADFIFLGMLTLSAGTLDGCHSLSAGMTGFGNCQLDPQLAARFEECPYRLEYFRYGHYSGHFGFTAPSFVKNYIAPLLMQTDVRDPAVELPPAAQVASNPAL